MNIQETVEMSNRYHPYSNNIMMPQYDCKLLILKVPPRPVSPPELKVFYPGMDTVPLPSTAQLSNKVFCRSFYFD